MISEKVQVATTMRPKVAMLTSGMDRSVVAMKRGNARGARGAGHPLYDPFIVANRQRDEPLGCSGGRQPSSGGTSRMTGDRLVRICEGSRVKFLRSTRHRQIFFGDPASGLVWDQLAEHLIVPLTADNGALIIPRTVAIDSGHLSQEVYNFCRHNAVRRSEFGLQQVFAIKGVSAWTAPALGKPTDQDIDYRGDRVARGAKLWPIGTSTIKQSLYAWLRITTPGPHHVHFSDELPAEFYDQLTSEKLQTRYRYGHPFREWHLPGGRRNEALDCFVYCYAAAGRMQLHLFRPAQWDARRKERAATARAEGKPAEARSHAATEPPTAPTPLPAEISARD